jgi:hypothetical protein
VKYCTKFNLIYFPGFLLCGVLTVLAGYLGGAALMLPAFFILFGAFIYAVGRFLCPHCGEHVTYWFGWGSHTAWAGKTCKKCFGHLDYKVPFWFKNE